MSLNRVLHGAVDWDGGMAQQADAQSFMKARRFVPLMYQSSTQSEGLDAFHKMTPTKATFSGKTLQQGLKTFWWAMASLALGTAAWPLFRAESLVPTPTEKTAYTFTRTLRFHNVELSPEQTQATQQGYKMQIPFLPNGIYLVRFTRGQQGFQAQVFNVLGKPVDFPGKPYLDLKRVDEHSSL
ncbi:MAG: hypothetical protein U0003_00715 [Vampirovibrionales bacterium]